MSERDYIDVEDPRPNLIGPCDLCESTGRLKCGDAGRLPPPDRPEGRDTVCVCGRCRADLGIDFD